MKTTGQSSSILALWLRGKDLGHTVVESRPNPVFEYPADGRAGGGCLRVRLDTLLPSHVRSIVQLESCEKIN